MDNTKPKVDPIIYFNLHGKGFTTAQIANECNVTTDTVNKFLKRQGLKPNTSRDYLTIEEKAQIQEMFCEHQETIGDIAKCLNRKVPTISLFVKRNGLSRHECLSNRSRLRIVEGKGVCAKCNESKDLSCFAVTGAQKFLHSICKLCKSRNDADVCRASPESFVKRKIHFWKSRAKKLGVPFNLSSEYVIGLFERQNRVCFYTDVPLVWFESDMRSTASLDRVVPERGYTRGNVVVCSLRINSAKSDFSLEEMKSWMPLWHERIIRCGWLSGCDSESDKCSWQPNTQP